MNAQDYQTFMAEMIRRQNPNAAMTRKSQIQGALNKPLSFNSPDMPNQVGHPITMESQLGKILNVDPSGMAASGYAKDAPSKGSIEGRQRISDNQRKYAQSLRGGAAPQGRTAGPLDVYYGPNIGESLAYATDQMVGGYMEGKADKEDAAIDEARQLEKALALKTANEQQAFENQNITNTFDLSEKTLNQKKDEDTATRAARIEAARVLALANKEKQDFEKGKGQKVTYSTPDGNVTVKEDTSGISWDFDEEGNITNTIKIKDGWKKLDERRSVSMTKAEADASDAATGAADDAEYAITQASNIFRAPNQIWNDGTGVGLDSIITGASGFANPFSGAGPEVQKFQMAITQLGMDGMTNDFARLNLGQINKSELALVMSANANWKTEPYGLVGVQAGKIPQYRKAFNKGIKEKTHTASQRDMHLQLMEDDVIFGAAQTNQKTGKPTMSMSDLESRGVDVTARRAELAEKLETGTATQADIDLLKAIIFARKAEG
tara:strand:+ start:427 stop:1905 length:1479 start_codon:yes stop_codon:yes gene_type:complete